MKYWKIMVVGLIVLLVVALGLLTRYALESDEHRTNRKSIAAAKKRIETYRVVAEEQKLIRQILEDKIEVAKIQAAIPKGARAPNDPNKP